MTVAVANLSDVARDKPAATPPSAIACIDHHHIRWSTTTQTRNGVKKRFVCDNVRHSDTLLNNAVACLTSASVAPGPPMIAVTPLRTVTAIFGIVRIMTNVTFAVLRAKLLQSRQCDARGYRDEQSR